MCFWYFEVILSSSPSTRTVYRIAIKNTIKIYTPSVLSHLVPYLTGEVLIYRTDSLKQRHRSGTLFGFILLKIFPNFPRNRPLSVT